MIDNLDFYSYLENYCKENNIFFIPGQEDYRNAVADENVYEAYDLILCSDLTLTPNFYDEDGSVTYNGTIALGRKREITEDEETVSSLDETFQQKYNRRLHSLISMLYNMINEIRCDADAEILSCTMSYALNQYDLNADFIVANISIKF